MRTNSALKQCAEWLCYCLEIGWPKSTLDRLEDLWWQYHDDCGRLIQSRAEREGEKS